MLKTFSQFHKLTVADGLEALATRNYNLSFPFHFHQTYNISLVYDGVFRTRVQGRNLIAEAGSILITNPLQIHSNPVETDEVVSFFTFYISPGFFNYSTRSQPSFFHDNIVYDEAIFAALHQIAIQIDAGDNSFAIEQELNCALNLLAHKYASFDNERKGMIDSRTLFDDYLANQDLEKFSLDHTAKQFGIDKFKFLRMFKYETGLTPNNYFILKRIEKSKEMLFAGNDILSTAIDLGFYDIPHFSKHFKKFTGISPAAYSQAVVLPVNK